MRIWSGWYGAALVIPVLLIALFPALRNSAFRYEMGGEVIPNSLWMSPLDPGSRGFDKSKPRDTRSVAARVWQLVGTEETYYADDVGYDPVPPAVGAPIPSIFSASPLKDLFRISQAHPENALALIQTLIHADAIDGRVAGPWEIPWDFRYVSRLGMTCPRVRSFLKPSDLETGLVLARRGQKLEPNNTFFDWALAHFLFAARRDDEAVQTLQRATHKTGFDLHLRDLMPAGFEKLGNAPPPLAEEKWLLFTSQTGLDNATWPGHVVNMTLWTAMQKHESGDAKGAFDIEAAMQHLCAVWADQAIRDGDKRVAFKELEIIWAAPQTIVTARAFRRSPRLSGVAQSEEERIKKVANEFADEARLRGRGAAAQEALRLLPLKLDVELRGTVLNDLVGTEFLRREGEGTITRLALAWTGIQLAWWQGWFALALFGAFTLLGPLLPPREQPVLPYSPRLFRFSLLGGALLTLGGGFLCCWYCLHFLVRGQWRAYDDLRFPFLVLADYVLLLLGLSILGALLVGTLSCIIWTSRIKKTMPPLPPEPLPYPRHVGAHPEMERFHIWFWASTKFFWFRMLPILCPLTFLLCGISTLQLQLPLGIHGEWVNLNTPLLVDNEYVLGCLTTALSLGALYLLSLLIRWRFFMPRFQRPAVYAGFFAFRRILGWTFPLALWIMLASMIFACAARQQFDGQIDAFLRSEGTAGAPAHR